MAGVGALIGLGLPPQLARLIGWTMQTVSAVGATAASATQLLAGNAIQNVFSGTSGVQLPKLGGDGPGYGAHVGDIQTINNESGAAIQVYALNNDAGSAVTIYGRGASTAGTTGVSVASGYPQQFQYVSSSTIVLLGCLSTAP